MIVQTYVVSTEKKGSFEHFKLLGKKITTIFRNFFFCLTHCLLVLSAHNLYKQIGPRSDGIPARIFQKKLIMKKISRRQKSIETFQGGKE